MSASIPAAAKRSRQKIYLVEGARKHELLVQMAAEETSAVLIVTAADPQQLCDALTQLDVSAALYGAETESTRFVIVSDGDIASVEARSRSFVIGFDLPETPEAYLLRLERLTEEGVAVTLVAPEENSRLYAIEKAMNRAIPQEIPKGFKPAPTGKRPPKKRPPKAKNERENSFPQHKKGSKSKKAPIRRISLDEQKKRPSS